MHRDTNHFRRPSFRSPLWNSLFFPFCHSFHSKLNSLTSSNSTIVLYVSFTTLTTPFNFSFFCPHFQMGSVLLRMKAIPRAIPYCHANENACLGHGCFMLNKSSIEKPILLKIIISPN